MFKTSGIKILLLNNAGLTTEKIEKEYSSHATDMKFTGVKAVVLENFNENKLQFL